ncbi:MAG: phosphoadenylyl-sulfate reductase [Candidatus Geothermarchaeales archaeon]
MDEKVAHSLELIEDAVKNYWPRIAVACSGGKDSIALVHLARQVKPDIPVFFVDTPFKPQETRNLIQRIKEMWKLNLKVYRSKKKVPPDLHLTDPDQCCRILKVDPTKEAVKDLDCWLSGIRNNEGKTRRDYREVEVRGGLVKVNPLLEWTEADVWRYTATRRLPVHPWYAEGYRSIGCTPCSHPGGVDERNGRWKGTTKQGGECGIHTICLKDFK